MDKKLLLNILNDWNYWENDISTFYERESYQKKIKEFDKTDEITVIKGIRRCGKSTLLINHIKELISNGVNKKEILCINFEDPRLINDLHVGLLDEILEVYNEYINNNTKPYIFLDEIQNIPAFEKWVRTKYELKKVKKIYITGSSSKLLSKEFGTALSGRYLDIEVFTLSFKEYLLFKSQKFPTKTEFITKKVEYKKLFNQYLEEGGFPKVILSEKSLQKKEIFIYYETIILKDIVARYNLKNFENIKKVAFYLISNIGKPISINNIKTSLNISYDLVEKYYEYLKDTYLIFDLSKYDSSLKKQFSSQNKVYTGDLSFNYNLGFKFSEDLGRILENLVFIELKRSELEIYYHKDKKECDFLIKQGHKIVQAIQVTRTLNNEETKKREIEGLIDAMKSYKLKTGLILTEDEENEFIENEYKIKVMPIWKWLLIEN